MEWQIFNESLVKGDIRCINCAFYFHGSICANHDSPVGYGGEISEPEEFSCGEWKAEIIFFDTRLKEIEREKNTVNNRPL